METDIIKTEEDIHQDLVPILTWDELIKLKDPEYLGLIKVGNKISAPGSSIKATFSYKSGVTTKDLSEASGSITTIAHNLGATPATIILTGTYGDAEGMCFSYGTYDGTTNYNVQSDFNGNNGHTDTSNVRIIYFRPSNNATEQAQSGVATFDTTNITITWTKINLPTGTASILWEAYA